MERIVYIIIAIDIKDYLNRCTSKQQHLQSEEGECKEISGSNTQDGDVLFIRLME